MLALTRKKSESIMIGDNVEIIVLGIQGEQVKLGIIAPKSVSIHRKEIYEQIQDENKEASSHVKGIPSRANIKATLKEAGAVNASANLSGR